MMNINSSNFNRGLIINAHIDIEDLNGDPKSFDNEDVSKDSKSFVNEDMTEGLKSFDDKKINKNKESFNQKHIIESASPKHFSLSSSYAEVSTNKCSNLYKRIEEDRIDLHKSYINYRKLDKNKSLNTKMRIILLFALILTIFGTFSSAIPVERGDDEFDGCARIVKNYINDLKENKTNIVIKYKDVKDCYLSFPFDLKRATQSDVNQLIVDLKDAHTSFLPTCYSAFNFKQSILLYSSVNSNGYQAIKVFYDSQDRSNVGCEVTHIDEYPALDVITEFAKKYIKNSRDLGVRFNMALASLKLNYTNYAVINGSFALRTNLPEKESVIYNLKCSKATKKLERPWIITFNSDLNVTFTNFTDSKSYYSNVCLMKNVSQSTVPKKAYILNLPIEHLEQVEIKLSLNDVNISYIGDFAAVYKIGELGVFVIPSFEPNSNDTDIILGLTAKFDSFAKSGIVLDFTNNDGGYVVLSQYVNNLFFPQKRAAFPRDIKINNIMTFFIKQAEKLNLSIADITPVNTLSYSTYKPFNTSDEYIGNNQFTRGGVTTNYSNLFNEIYENSTLLDFLSTWKFPWSNKDVIILTNGACGSSCAQTTQYLAEQAKFSTVSVGGLFNRNMSYSSFPGGSVIAVKDFYNDLAPILTNTSINLPEIPKNFATEISMKSLSFSFSESYSIAFPNNLTEFMYRPATYRLYYDEKSIFDPSLLWLQALSALITLESRFG
ncbi:15486_t:CDS:2 [Cetraspora pellucida]|uniref:15486_t:CDS:1 n=1 Tax=Cetraspora pellucida TaxID=1433469 RepID=A0A9N9F102_9GLOM|nr:15486_t:CDS:2 [Cetraspora pellucida]